MARADARQPLLRLLAVGLLALPLVMTATGSTWAAWSVQTQNTGNQFTALTLDPPSNLQLVAGCNAAPPASLRASAQNASQANNGPPPAVAKPSGVQQGDFLLAQVVAKETISAPAGSGWVLLREDAVGTTLYSALFYKFAGATEPFTYGWETTSNRWAVGISAWTGVHPSNPIGANDAATATTGTTVSAPAVTTTRPNQRILAMFAQANSTAFSPAGPLWDIGSTAGPSPHMRADGKHLLFAGPGTNAAQTVTGQAGTEKIGQRVVLNRAADDVSVSATWSGSGSAVVDGHRLVRAQGGTDQSTFTLTPRTVASYIDGPVQPSTTYDYRVTAFMGPWSSAPVTASVTSAATC